MLSILRYTDSDYPFGIFKLFLKVALNTITLTRTLVSHEDYYILDVYDYLLSLASTVNRRCYSTVYVYVVIYFWLVLLKDLSCSARPRVGDIRIVGALSMGVVVLSDYNTECTTVDHSG